VAALIEGLGFKGRQFTSEIILWAVLVSDVSGELP
jgi:hypothetical protein